MFRNWRIQFSMICLALLAATIDMWVRSYRWADYTTELRTSGLYFDISSYSVIAILAKAQDLSVLVRQASGLKVNGSTKDSANWLRQNVPSSRSLASVDSSSAVFRLLPFRT